MAAAKASASPWKNRPWPWPEPARLIQETLRHSNGLPVECVLAETCIGGVAEAAQAANKFARENVGHFNDGNTLLVLWLGNHGHEPLKYQSGLGFQRH